MLQCTSEAASSLATLRSENDVPDDFGVRLHASQTPQGDVTLGIDFAPEPAEGDAVTEQHGTKLMVAPEIADELSAMTLDVVVEPSHDGQEARQFVLRPNDETTSEA